MAIGEGARVQAQLVTAQEKRTRLAHLLTGATPKAEADQVRAVYIHAKHDHSLRVGFITGASDTFCAGCDRLRISAEGHARPCLAIDVGLRLITKIAMTRQSVAARIDEAWREKPDGRTWNGCTELSAAEVSMRAVGGLPLTPPLASASGPLSSKIQGR